MSRATVKKASAAAKPTVAAIGVDGEARFVRLTGIAARASGKTLPIGKSLRIGVDIPEGLAEARLKAGSAERVSASAITAEALREAGRALVTDVRRRIDAYAAALDAAEDAKLAEVASGQLEDIDGASTGSELTEAFDDAIRAHRAALETEAAAAEPQVAEPSGGGTETA